MILVPSFSIHDSILMVLFLSGIVTIPISGNFEKKLGCLSNTLAYHDMGIITSVKGVIEHVIGCKKVSVTGTK
jgi:hypothetical protein